MVHTIFDAKAQAFLCLHCGTRHTVLLPIPLGRLAERAQRFHDGHRDCEPPKPKLYLVAMSPTGGGDVAGIARAEDGRTLASHVSSSLSFLRLDLLSKIPDQDAYEVVDLLIVDLLEEA